MAPQGNYCPLTWFAFPESNSRPHGEPDKYGKARFAINTLTGFNTGEMFEMKRRTRLAGLMLRVF